MSRVFRVYYAVAESPAWLAKERRDVQEQLQMKQQIHELVRPRITGFSN